MDEIEKIARKLTSVYKNLEIKRFYVVKAKTEFLKNHKKYKSLGCQIKSEIIAKQSNESNDIIWENLDTGKYSRLFSLF